MKLGESSKKTSEKGDLRKICISRRDKIILLIRILDHSIYTAA